MVDHTEEERRVMDDFSRLYDKKAGPAGDRSELFLNKCTKRVPKRRPHTCMSEAGDEDQLIITEFPAYVHYCVSAYTVGVGAVGGELEVDARMMGVAPS